MYKIIKYLKYYFILKIIQNCYRIENMHLKLKTLGFSKNRMDFYLGLLFIETILLQENIQLINITLLRYNTSNVKY